MTTITLTRATEAALLRDRLTELRRLIPHGQRRMNHLELELSTRQRQIDHWAEERAAIEARLTVLRTEA